MCALQIAVASADIVSSLLTLASSDSNEVQVCSAHCLARFAAWQGVAQQAICTPKNAEVMLSICLTDVPCLPLPLTLPIRPPAESLESLLPQQQNNSWSPKGNLSHTHLLSDVVFCVLFMRSKCSTQPDLRVQQLVGPAGCEQRVLRRLPQMLGKHVLCLPECMPAAQLVQ